jgi:hypothetical protein
MKLSISLIFVLICLVQILLSKKKRRNHKRKQLVLRPRCARLYEPAECEDLTHCRWSDRLDQCVERRAVLIHRRRALMAQPISMGGYGGYSGYSNYGINSSPRSVGRPYSAFSSKSLSTSRPSSVSVSRPTSSVSVSRPVSSGSIRQSKN